jgi:hypothetical protein
VKLEGFRQVCESFLLALSLAGNIDFQALRDIPLPLAPNGRGKWSLHALILSYTAPRRAWSANNPVMVSSFAEGQPPHPFLVLNSVGSRESLVPVELLCGSERVRFLDKTMFAPPGSQTGPHSVVNSLLE